MTLTKHGHVCEKKFSCDFWVFEKNWDVTPGIRDEVVGIDDAQAGPLQ
jgi:hypothetical protein